MPCEVIPDREEAYHLIKVMRLSKGSRILLTDGTGNLYEGLIINAEVNRCVVGLQTIKEEFGKRNFNLHIAVAPTKNMARFEWFLEKATEIGIDEITPLICEHSERVQLRADRLQKIILSAAKQSVKTYLPVIHEPIKFPEFVSRNFLGSKFVAYMEERQPVHLKNAYQHGDCIILIGPEGDFSKKEIELALKQEFQPISLGPARLRTETAALVACHIINLMNE